MNHASGADLARFRVVGPERQRAIEMLDRLVAASCSCHGVSDVEMDLRRVGMRGQVRLVRLDRLLDAAQHLQVESQEEQRILVVVAYRFDEVQELERAAVLAVAVRGERRFVLELQRTIDRGRAAARLVLAKLQVPPRRDVLGTAVKDEPQLFDGLPAAPRDDPDIRQVEARLDVVGASGQVDGVGAGGFLGPPEHEERVGFREAGTGVRGVDLEHGPGGGERTFEEAGARTGESEAVSILDVFGIERRGVLRGGERFVRFADPVERHR